MFKTFKAKMKLRKARKHCYKANKAVGLAVQGVCRGHHFDGIPSVMCAVCPYFADNFTTEEC